MCVFVEVELSLYSLVEVELGAEIIIENKWFHLLKYIRSLYIFFSILHLYKLNVFFPPPSFAS